MGTGYFSRIGKRFVLAVQFLTILPVAAVRSVSDTDMRQSVVFYPVVGLFLGGGLWTLQWILTRVLPATAATVISLAVYTVMTGFLHLDGMIDMADALGSRKPRQKALLIMRDSRVGAIGAASGVLVLLGKFAVLSNLSIHMAGAFIVIPALSRWSMVLAMSMAPYARVDQAGLGSLFANQISWVSVGIASLIAMGAAVVLLPMRMAVSLWLFVFLGTVLFVRLLTRRFGGMTGDIYGALNELMEWLGWTLVLLWHG